MSSSTSERLVLEVQDLVKHFVRRGSPDHVAVDGVSFDVERGQSLALVGASGSGKTTVARIVVGLEFPTSGRVSVAGRERAFGRLSTRERRACARETQIVFQDPYSSLDRRQTVGSALAEVLKLHFGLRGSGLTNRIDELLESVGLDASQARSRPTSLSGGQRQRVAIARALAAEPALLVLDEPVSALDVSIQAQILNLLRDIQTQNEMAFLFISHDLAVVRQVCSHAAVMQNGKIVEIGPVSGILDHPQHEYTKALRQAVVDPASNPAREARGGVDAGAVHSGESSGNEPETLDSGISSVR
jgi:oligopeptide transport system ATP-binding protein